MAPVRATSVLGPVAIFKSTRQKDKATSTRMRFQINTVFKSLRFRPSTRQRSVFESLRFRKSPLSNPFSKVSVSGENGDFRKRWIKATSTRIRFRAKTETFLFVFAFRPHANAYVWTYTCGRGDNKRAVPCRKKVAPFQAQAVPCPKRYSANGPIVAWVTCTYRDFLCNNMALRIVAKNRAM